MGKRRIAKGPPKRTWQHGMSLLAVGLSLTALRCGGDADDEQAAAGGTTSANVGGAVAAGRGGAEAGPTGGSATRAGADAGGAAPTGGKPWGGTGGGAGAAPIAFDGDCTPEGVRCVAPAGEPESEYQTIQDAVDAAGPGDWVAVFAGTYAGCSVERGGDEAARLRVSAVEAGVLIDRDGPTTDAIRLQNVSDVTIEGFTIEGPTAACIGARGADPDRPMARLEIRGNT
ncbi:MAG TPA: hypothetical protein PLU22_02930, partial [Polyangiaceae bacterium]|nr:hypothetical protein [Polyangiaceae bacterium]